VTGEPIRGPERAYFQRLRGNYSKVSSTGTLTLTVSELAFNSRIGRELTVALADITAVHTQKIKRFHIGGADAQLVVETARGQIGFLLKDPEGWERDVVHLRAAQQPPDDPRQPGARRRT